MMKENKELQYEKSIPDAGPMLSNRRGEYDKGYFQNVHNYYVTVCC